MSFCTLCITLVIGNRWGVVVTFACASVARWRPANSNRRMAFSARSAKQQLDTASEERCFLSCRCREVGVCSAIRRVGGWCEMAASLGVSQWVEWVYSNSVEVQLLGAQARRQFRNPEEGERPPLEAATEQRLVKTGTLVCVIVNCKV
jgi:hypothetical protein